MTSTNLTTSREARTARQIRGRAPEQSRPPALLEPQDALLSLQQAAGNQAVSQLLQRARNTTPLGGVPPVVRSVIAGGGGRPLDGATRAFMEPLLGRDFGHVRVHTDPQAVTSARAVDAAAYTVGHDVVMGSEGYAPATQGGRHLLAHELAHVAQVDDVPAASLRTADTGGAWEADAGRAASAVSHGQTYDVRTGAPIALYRLGPEGLSEPGRGPGYQVRLRRLLTERLARNPAFLLKAVTAFIRGAISGVKANVRGEDARALSDRFSTSITVQIPSAVSPLPISIKPAITAAFVGGTLYGLAKGIVGSLQSLVKLARKYGVNPDELTDDFLNLLESLATPGSEEAIGAVGVQTGTQFADKVKGLIRASDEVFGFELGKMAGPALVGVVLSILTGGAAGVATAAMKVVGVLGRLTRFRAVLSRLRSLGARAKQLGGAARAASAAAARGSRASAGTAGVAANRGRPRGPIIGPTAGVRRRLASRAREKEARARERQHMAQPGSRPPAQAGRTFLAVGDADAMPKYLELIKRTPGREAAVYRDPVHHRWAVVQGEGDWARGTVPRPDQPGRWILVEHYHPERNPWVQFPSLKDFEVLIRGHGGRRAITGKVESKIRYVDPATGEYHFSTFSYDPTAGFGKYHVTIELRSGQRVPFSFNYYHEYVAFVKRIKRGQEIPQ